MMRHVLSRVLASGLLIALTAGCLGGSDSTLTSIDPADAAALFDSPTGTVEAGTATSVVNMAVAGTHASAGVYAAGINYFLAREEATFSACFSNSSDATKTILDVKCLSDAGGFGIRDHDSGILQTPCAGVGQVTAGTGVQFQYCDDISFDGFGSNCSGSPVLSSFTGEYRTTATEPPAETPAYVCMNVSYSLDGKAKTFNGCWSSSSTINVLVDSGGGPVHVRFGGLGADCATLCVDVQDKTGWGKIDCQASDKEESCTHWQHVLEVADCTLTPGASC
ncbi:MAG: hypothetical protein V1798_08015 [Pseudomonadota bacterium]